MMVILMQVCEQRSKERVWSAQQYIYDLAATVPSDNFTVILVSTTPYQNYDKEEWDMNATPIYIYFFSGS